VTFCQLEERNISRRILAEALENFAIPRKRILTSFRIMGRLLSFDTERETFFARSAHKFSFP